MRFEEIKIDYVGLCFIIFLYCRLDNGALDMVDEIDINNNSTLVEIRAYWGKIVRLVAVLQGAKDEAEIIVTSKVSEEMEDLKNRLIIANDDSKKYKDENEKMKL